jgi:oligopeptide transport system ATP-binding protein
MSGPPDIGVPLLQARSVAVRYHTPALAVRGVSFELESGGALGICGESGSGKSSLVRALLGLTPLAAGEVLWRGRSLAGFGTGEWQALRRMAQPIFQDPLASLDPRMRVGDLLAEPLRLLDGILGRPTWEARIASMLARVGLSDAVLSRYPHELSGGQCQRVCIARAMLPGPAVLACDEPVSALDVSIQAQVIELLRSLHREAGVTLIFVSHNLAVVRRLCSRVLVMRGGEVVESGATEAVFANPGHAYTRQLIAAVPSLPRRQAATTGS